MLGELVVVVVNVCVFVCASGARVPLIQERETKKAHLLA